MSYHDYNEFYRLGSGGLADTAIRRRAGLYAGRGLFTGYDERGRACFSNQQAATLLVGGARCGKGNLILPWLIDGHFTDHIISMDWKAQNGSIAQLQALQRRAVYNWDPRGRCEYAR